MGLLADSLRGLQTKAIPTQRSLLIVLFGNGLARQQRIIDLRELNFNLGPRLGPSRFGFVILQRFQRLKQVKEAVISIHSLITNERGAASRTKF
jgi:hypothetical protein